MIAESIAAGRTRDPKTKARGTVIGTTEATEEIVIEAGTDDRRLL